MKKIAMLIVVILSSSIKGAYAQTQAGSPSDLLAWAKSQYVNTGMAFDLMGGKYSSSSWDLVSYGESGLNVGKSGALDFIDFGPETSIPIQLLPGSAVPDAATRYGLEWQVHAGNIWNSIKLPKPIASHVSLANIGNVTGGLIFLIPHRRAVDKWNWKQDAQLAVVYRF